LTRNVNQHQVTERLSKEVKRRTRIVRIFPNEASSLRPIRAVALEMHETCLEAPRYLNRDYWRERRPRMATTCLVPTLPG
jgi:putative transposase